MESKPWYSSQTIRAAICSFIIAISPIGFKIIDNGWDSIDAVDVGIFFTAYIALDKTISGRTKADTDVKTPVWMPGEGKGKTNKGVENNGKS